MCRPGYIIVLLCILCCCSYNKTSTEGKSISLPQDSLEAVHKQVVYPFHIKKDKSEKREDVFIQDMARVRYVRLETTEKCLLPRKGLFDGIYLDEENIFISFGSMVYRFSETGKFLNVIGSKGAGPGELGFGCAFSVEPRMQEVYLFDFFRRRMLVYDYKGTMKRNFRVSVPGDHFYILNDSNAVFCSNEPVNSGSRIVIGTLDKGKTKEKLLDGKLTLYKRLMVNIGAYSKIIPHREYINLCMATDTIFAYNKNTLRLEPRFIQQPLNSQLESEDVKTVPYLQFESDKYVSILVNDRPFPDFTYVVNKESGDVRKIRFIDKNAGKKVWCWGTNKPNTVIDFLNVTELMELLSDNKLSGELLSLSKLLKEEDNPVLMLATFE